MHLATVNITAFSIQNAQFVNGIDRIPIPHAYTLHYIQGKRLPLSHKLKIWNRFAVVVCLFVCFWMVENIASKTWQVLKAKLECLHQINPYNINNTQGTSSLKTLKHTNLNSGLWCVWYCVWRWWETCNFITWGNQEVTWSIWVCMKYVCNHSKFLEEWNKLHKVWQSVCAVLTVLN